MPAAQLAILVKLSGGFLPPDSRAGDIEIYDNGQMKIYESDTAIADRQIGRQKVVDILTYARNNGFFTAEAIFHDQGTGTAPDVTISMTDQGGSVTITATAYQKLRGEMRKSPFDLVYKYITNVAWESYNNATTETTVSAENSSSNPPLPTAPMPAVQPGPVMAPLQFSPQTVSQVPAAPSEPKTVFDALPSLDALLKDDSAGNVPPSKSPSLPPLQSSQQRTAGATTTNSALPPLNRPREESAPQNNTSLPALDSRGATPKQQVPPLDAILRASDAPINQPTKPPVQQVKQQQVQPPKASEARTQGPTLTPKQPVQARPEQKMQNPTVPNQQKQAQQTRPEQKLQTPPVNNQSVPQPLPKPVQASPTLPPPATQEEKLPQRNDSMREREPAPPLPTAALSTGERGPQAQPTHSQERPVEKQVNTPLTHDRPLQTLTPPRAQEQPRQQLKAITRQRQAPPLAWRETQELIAKIESAMQAKVLVIHVRPDHYFNAEDVRSLYRHLRPYGHKQKLVVLPIIHDGEITAVARLAEMLRAYGEEISVLVPDEMSVLATLLTLSANKIVMNGISYLVPIETQFSHPALLRDDESEPVEIPLRDILAAQAGSLKESLDPIVLAGAQRFDVLVKTTVKKMLSLGKIKSDKADLLVTKLTEGFPTADYPISYQEAKDIGLPVEQLRDDINDYVDELLAHYAYISHPFYNVQDHHTIRHAHEIVLETAGKRTVLYEERLTEGEFDEIVEEHTRWRQLSEELTLTKEGKEQSNLRWKELALVQSEE